MWWRHWRPAKSSGRRCKAMAAVVRRALVWSPRERSELRHSTARNCFRLWRSRCWWWIARSFASIRRRWQSPTRCGTRTEKHPSRPAYSYDYDRNVLHKEMHKRFRKLYYHFIIIWNNVSHQRFLDAVNWTSHFPCILFRATLLWTQIKHYRQ